MSRSAAWWDRHAGYDQNLWIDHPFEGAAYLPRWTKTRDTPAVRHRREGTPMLTVVTDENAHAHMAAGLDEIVREGASSPCRRSAACTAVMVQPASRAMSVRLAVPRDGERGPRR